MSATVRVRVQEGDFDVASLQRSLLQGDAAEGAIATFTGYVRNSNNDRPVLALELEHYPGMTERSITSIARDACARWPLLAVGVVHRVGKLKPANQIVWVGVSAKHREAAFAACEFIMDYLKTRAPFWKKETGPDGSHWVDARQSDNERAGRW
ncbi:molybdopterin synthase catalytic subunit MoaE [Seongchinamella unica]|uniref:Molybdopterin synthase catalytic subunit n=1 Tax=Seongchinamella unica TaxID=2547392 RepID=A0A4R5LSD4_9GAMM|nr:molybdopterin synthase catalytic subunit MoaE [Seongchinamella unica]TDG13823.1 molybdopterin synthase catalytic subunit MoaE [Seongchinamella unica]